MNEEAAADAVACRLYCFGWCFCNQIGAKTERRKMMMKKGWKVQRRQICCENFVDFDFDFVAAVTWEGVNQFCWCLICSDELRCCCCWVLKTCEFRMQETCLKNCVCVLFICSQFLRFFIFFVNFEFSCFEMELLLLSGLPAPVDICIFFCCPPPLLLFTFLLRCLLKKREM